MWWGAQAKQNQTPHAQCLQPATLLSSPVPLPATSHPSKEPDGSKLHKPKPNGKLLPSLHPPFPPILTAFPAPAPPCWPREDGKDGEKIKKKNNKNTRWVHVGLPTHSEGQPVLPGVLPEDDGGDAGDAHGSRVPRGSCPPHGSRVSLGRERQLLNTSRGFNACHRLETGPGQARSTLTVSPMGKWGQRCQCEL